MMLRSLFAPLMAAAIVAIASAEAQPQYSFPPEIIAAPMAPDCTGEFAVLKEEILQRRKLLDASVSYAQPNVTCGLISDFGRAELKMIRFFIRPIILQLPSLSTSP